MKTSVPTLEPATLSFEELVQVLLDGAIFGMRPDGSVVLADGAFADALLAFLHIGIAIFAGLPIEDLKKQHGAATATFLRRVAEAFLDSAVL